VVELKRAVTLAGVLQCVDRFAVTDLVYLAVPAAALPRSKRGGSGFKRLCRRLGLGPARRSAGGEVSALSSRCPLARRAATACAPRASSPSTPGAAATPRPAGVPAACAR
jgi:hypothetical protein